MRTPDTLKSILRSQRFRKLASGSLIAFVFSGLSLVFGFLLNIVLGRYIGVEGSGAYYIVLSVITALVILGRFGIDSAVIRLGAPPAATGDYWGFAKIARDGLVISIMLSVLFTVVVYVCAPTIANNALDKPYLQQQIRFMAISIVPMTIVFVTAQLLRTLGSLCQSQFVNFVQVPLFTGVILAAAALAEIPPSVDIAIGSYVIASAVTALTGLSLLAVHLQRFRRHSGSRDEQPHVSTMLSIAIPFFWMSLVEYLFAWAPVAIAGFFVSEKDVALLAVAMRTAFLVGFGMTCVSFVVTPRLAALYSAGADGEVRVLAQWGTRVSALFSGPVALCFLFASSTVMGLYGDAFKEGAILLAILAIGQLAKVLFSMANQLMIMTGGERVGRDTNFLGMLVLFVLLLVLTPKYGVSGAAVAVSAGFVAKNLPIFIIARRRFGYWTI